MIKASRFIIANGDIPGREMGKSFNIFFMPFLKRGVLAAVLGVILAVAGTAFTPANNDVEQRAEYWFETDASGQPGDPIMGVPSCDEQTQTYCAKLYDESDVNLDGSGNPVSVKSGSEDDEIDSRFRLPN